MRRNLLRDATQQPVRAKNMVHVMDAVADWEANCLAYAKADGASVSEEERRAQVMKLLPPLSMEELEKANEVVNDVGDKDAESLIEWLRAKSIFHSENGAGKPGALHVMAPSPLTPEAQPGHDPHYDGWTQSADGGWYPPAVPDIPEGGWDGQEATDEE